MESGRVKHLFQVFNLSSSLIYSVNSAIKCFFRKRLGNVNCSPVSDNWWTTSQREYEAAQTARGVLLNLPEKSTADLQESNDARGEQFRIEIMGLNFC